MRAIIEGKRYDTDTAEELGAWSNMNDITNWRYEDYSVYHTPKGTYFLQYSGGPLSSRGSRSGNEYRGNKGIQPLTEQEAREHLERCGDDGIAAIERFFPVEEA